MDEKLFTVKTAKTSCNINRNFFQKSVSLYDGEIGHISSA